LSGELVGAVEEFSVLQFNTLSDTFSDAFPRCPKQYLKWEYRFPKLVERIKAKQPTFICLQEVDHPEEFQKSLIGYKSLYLPKGAGGKDGSMLLYPEEMTLLSHQFLYYPDGNQVAILANFDFCCIVTTHLKSKEAFESLRVQQAHTLLKEVELFAEGKPRIICLDMNSEPGGAVYPLFREKLQSAYCSQEGLEPLCTTYKFREKGVCRTIDYIFYTGLKCLEMAPLLTPEQIGKDGLPNANYPSDHQSLWARFQVLSEPLQADE
jgi:mRNA deadenylase 3'-5' endonuclease subunit Ccr4